MLDTAKLPDDIAALKAMLIPAEVRDQRKDEQIAQLEKLVAAFKQPAFGRRSEKNDADQFELALEDLETAVAVIQAQEDAEDRLARRPAKPRSTNRVSRPKQPLRIEEIIEPQSLVGGCGGGLHCIGEDVSEWLRVIVIRRPKYACRSCTDGMVQAPVPGRLIPGGPLTEAMVAHVLVNKLRRPNLVTSGKSKRVVIDGYPFLINFHRLQTDTTWSLEVVDHQNDSHVWDSQFQTDSEACDAALAALNSEGAIAFMRGNNDVHFT